MRVLWLLTVPLVSFAVLAQNNDVVKTYPATEQAILEFRKSHARCVRQKGLRVRVASRGSRMSHGDS
jgi:hypothetical protein